MFTEKEKRQIADSVRKYLEMTSISQNKFAAQLGVSAATVSLILNSERWPVVSNEMWKSVANKVMFGKGWLISSTKNFKRIQGVCRALKLHGEMRAIIGPTDAGKTSALKNYRLNNANTFYVHCNESMSKRDLLYELITELGIDAKKLKGATSRYKLICRIADELNQRSSPLIILDDFGKLSLPKRMVVQEIYDMTEGNCGILLSSVDYAYEKFIKDAESEKPGMPELKRRLGDYFERLSAPEKSDIELVARDNGIEDGSAIQWLVARCTGFGSLKTKISDARKSGKPINADLFNALFPKLAIESLGGGRRKEAAHAV